MCSHAIEISLRQNGFIHVWFEGLQTPSISLNSLSYRLCNIWGCMYSLYSNIMRKSEVWPICHCLGLDNETMVCAVCVSIFYNLGKKGCYTPIEDNKTNVDRTFVFPLGWNWHDMDPWLFPNEIRHYLGQTFNARSSGIVELRNHSIGGRSPKSIFTLWQLWINICIFFQKFFWLFEQCPVQPLWVLGRRCLHLPVRALSKVLLLPVWVWLVLPSTAYSKGMLPLDLWCQASLQGLPERQHLGKTVSCWGWCDRIVSWVLGPWRRGWEICTEWGLVAQRLTTDSCPAVTGHIDPHQSPCWLPTTVVSAWSGRRGGGTWQWPTGSMSSSVMSRDSNFTR